MSTMCWMVSGSLAHGTAFLAEFHGLPLSYSNLDYRARGTWLMEIKDRILPQWKAAQIAEGITHNHNHNHIILDCQINLSFYEASNQITLQGDVAISTGKPTNINLHELRDLDTSAHGDLPSKKTPTKWNTEMQLLTTWSCEQPTSPFKMWGLLCVQQCNILSSVYNYTAETLPQWYCSWFFRRWHWSFLSP